MFHNGAVVHWVFPYSKMKAPNVLSTLECMRLATTGDRLKSFHFVSSTAVLDSDYHAKCVHAMPPSLDVRPRLYARLCETAVGF